MDQEEVALEFKRFSKDKQEQIRQLVAYTTLMGLSGKDLVSIGGKLDRIEKRKDLEHRLSIVKTYEVKTIGSDKSMNHRFKIELNGITYHVYDDYAGAQVKNMTTKKQLRIHLDRDDWGRSGWKVRGQYQFLWDYHNGRFKLP